MPTTKAQALLEPRDPTLCALGQRVLHFDLEDLNPHLDAGSRLQIELPSRNDAPTSPVLDDQWQHYFDTLGLDTHELEAGIQRMLDYFDVQLMARELQRRLLP